MFKTIAIASDHGGYEYKETIKTFLAENFSEITVIDCGPNDTASVDYPDFAQAASDQIDAGDADGMILICGTGIGISIAANRYESVRAALCTDVTMARLTRQHNNANALALGQRIIGIETALDIVRTFLTTEFEGGRHQRRIDKINAKPHA